MGRFPETYNDPTEEREKEFLSELHQASHSSSNLVNWFFE